MPLSSIDMHKILRMENNKCVTFVLEIRKYNALLKIRLHLDWERKPKKMKCELQKKFYWISDQEWIDEVEYWQTMKYIVG